MNSFCSRRNFGFGKQPWFAVKRALLNRFGNGHFSTRATYESRWVEIIAWLLDARGIRDLRHVDLNVALELARHLKDMVDDEEYGIKTAHSMVSAFNVAMEALRGRRDVWVSAVEHLGRRSHVRTIPPIYMDRVDVVRITSGLRERGEHAVALGVEAAREGGLRFKEWCLADFRAFLREAEASGKITIFRGTKGSHERVIPCSDRLLKIVQEAAALQGDADNLIPAGKSYVQWRSHAYNAFYTAGGRHFHNLRASYACERYECLAGAPAPVLRKAGDPIPPVAVDRRTRQTLSEELGHHRRQASNAYCGGVRK
jgi:hypothetical protein